MGNENGKNAVNALGTGGNGNGASLHTGERSLVERPMVDWAAIVVVLSMVLPWAGLVGSLVVLGWMGYLG